MFFYEDVVIHASHGPHLGVEAIRRMLLEADTFHLVEGAWPARHTLLIEWDRLRSEARRKRPDEPRGDDSEETVRLEPPR